MEDEGIERIAEEWGVEVGLLQEVTWELQEREGNDGEVYGYFVSFDEDNDPAILAALGLRPGEFLREVSLNAFDEPDDGIYSIDEPLPDFSHFDLPEGEDEESDFHILGDEKGNYLSDGNGNLIGFPVEPPSLRKELVERLDRLEALLATALPPRGHNNPPELLSPNYAAEINEIVAASRALRREAQSAKPDPVEMRRAASRLRKIAGGLSAFAKLAAGGVVGSATWEGVIWSYENAGAIHQALLAVADTAEKWAHQIF